MGFLGPNAKIKEMKENFNASVVQEQKIIIVGSKKKKFNMVKKNTISTTGIIMIHQGVLCY